MRIYIAGPMSRIPNQNREAFVIVADQLRDLGHEPVNPIDHSPADLTAMADRMGEEFLRTLEYKALIGTMLKVVDECDAIFMLPGWGDSRGARQEWLRARRSMKPVFHSIDEIGGGVLKWTGDEAYGPTRTFTGDAGFDLYVSERTVISVGRTKDVPCGISIEMPPGVWGLVIGRSSTLRRRGLAINTSVIDNGYRGPMFAYAHNVGDEVVGLEPGERIAQLIPFQQVSAGLTPHRVAELSDSDRGESGFGSTGR